MSSSERTRGFVHGFRERGDRVFLPVSGVAGITAADAGRRPPSGKLDMATTGSPLPCPCMATPRSPLAKLSGDDGSPPLATRWSPRWLPRGSQGFVFGSRNGVPSHLRKSFVGGSHTPVALVLLVVPHSVSRQCGALPLPSTPRHPGDDMTMKPKCSSSLNQRSIQPLSPPAVVTGRPRCAPVGCAGEERCRGLLHHERAPAMFCCRAGHDAAVRIGRGYCCRGCSSRSALRVELCV